MLNTRLFPILSLGLFGVLALTSCGSGSSKQQTMAPAGDNPNSFDLVLIPASGKGPTIASFEAFKYDTVTGAMQKIAVPPVSNTREFTLTHSPDGLRLYTGALTGLDYEHERILMRSVAADGTISSVQHELVLNGSMEDIAIVGSGNWVLALRAGYFENGKRYWIESYPVASDGSLGQPVKTWEPPVATLIPGASSAPQWVEIFNRTSSNEDVWVWVHTFQLDAQDGVLAEDGTLYKVTIDAQTGEAANVTSHDFGQEYQPTFAQGNQYGFMGRTYQGGLKTISSSTLDQVSECTSSSEPSCNPVFALAARSDGARLFSLNLINNISSLSVSSSGAVTPIATESLNIAALPTGLASDTRGTVVFVGTNGLLPDAARTITVFKVQDDGSLVQGATVNSTNVEKIDVVSH